MSAEAVARPLVGSGTRHHRTGSPTDPRSTPAQRISRFTAAVEEALRDGDVARRVGQAGILVRFDFTDRPVQPVFLVLDVGRPRATTDAQGPRPDVVLTLATADLDCCLHDGEELPLRILSGEIRFEGPVRKFLRVLPVLRGSVEKCAAARGTV